LSLFHFRVGKKTDKTIYRREVSRRNICRSDLVTPLYFVLVRLMMTSVLSLTLSRCITKIYGL